LALEGVAQFIAPEPWLIKIDSTINMNEEIDAGTAAALLGVKRSTLYAYASRGLVRRRDTGKTSLYLKEDVERLRARHDARSGHGPVAASALQFGEPVLDTSITEITPVGPRYRGHAAVELAESGVSFERVAELLWTGELPPKAFITEPFTFPRGAKRWLDSFPAPLDRLSVALPLCAQVSPHRHPVGAHDELALAKRLVATLFGQFSERAAAPPDIPASERWVRSLGSLGPKQRAAISAALVLLADHELNASSFAARVAASTGADLFACCGAAVATLSGPKHGAAAERVLAFVDEARAAGSGEAALEDRTRRGEAIPGVGHPLYSEGDPRGRFLLRLARRLGKGRRLTLELADALETRGVHPNVDFGTVALCEGLGLARTTPKLLFALGRSAGWIAHIFEQRRMDFILRPRARYVPAKDSVE
jgi:citrate synthase